MCTHLQRRGKRYFLRRVVPADLREHYGKREITKALGTSDRKTASVLCRRLGLELDNEFQAIREQGCTVAAYAAQKPIEAAQRVSKKEPIPTLPNKQKRRQRPLQRQQMGYR